ncbi:hypothetical protein SEA_TRAX_45 [Gordonia phage Trax]|uniref:Uncharacterized protein n=1 Tax=Gordonia phage Trax TaxID=2591121 RepID=A0A515MGY0_9CAUD|nr:hypothetical protein L3Y20_gp045 [Gordonia phage Trax]QDM55932.1 hypothetical protein SEA_TRAX_45 [Gordonia phage Trax]
MRCVMSTGTAMHETFEKFVAEVRRLANENPNFIYKPRTVPGRQITCHYVNEDRTGGDCLIGQALFNTGMRTIEQLDEVEGRGAATVLRRYFDAPSALQRWATEVQGAQDDGVAWGEAVRRVDARHAELGGVQ